MRQQKTDCAPPERKPHTQRKSGDGRTAERTAPPAEKGHCNEKGAARATAEGGAATAEKPTDKNAAPTEAEAATRAGQSDGDPRKPERRQQPGRAHGRAPRGRAGTTKTKNGMPPLFKGVIVLSIWIPFSGVVVR